MTIQQLRKSKWFFLFLASAMAFLPAYSVAEDIDIYVGSTGASAAGNPNILIVLDNTSNWSRQSQQWPGGLAQGQSEVRAIKSVLSVLDDNVNLGMMEWATRSGGGNEGGFIRQAVLPMTTANKTAFSTKLDTIFSNINSPDEKINSSLPYGEIMFDVFKYFGGYTSPAHANDDVAGTPTDNNHFGTTTHVDPGKLVTSLADTNGYSTAFTNFQSPISSTNACGKNYVIVIANPNQSGPSADNSTWLSNVGGDLTQLPMPRVAATTSTTTTTLGNTANCYANQASCISNLASETTYTASCSSYTDGCSCGSSVADPGSCAVGTQKYSVFGTKTATPAGGTRLGYDSSCAANFSQCSTAGFAAQCANYDQGCACKSTDYVTTGCTGSKKKYAVYATQSATTSTNLGYTANCYGDVASCSTADYTAACANYSGGCSCNSPTTTGSSCAVGTSKFAVSATDTSTVLAATGSSYPAGTYQPNVYGDEWARFLYHTDVSPVTGQQNVITYTIDVYNKAPDAGTTSLLMHMAKHGGGKYFAATDEEKIKLALLEILTEIQAVNSTFASASLPLNATNRSQSENQVFIGMFRPDSHARPRWLGNMKRYQLAPFAGNIDLADANGLQAVNPLTGFISECAQSFWTTDSVVSGNGYWENVSGDPRAAGECLTSAADPYSDLPDGPWVEKGATAEVVRKANGAADGGTTWALSRSIKTTDSGGSTFETLAASHFSSITPPDGCTSTDLYNFVTGANLVFDESVGSGCLAEHPDLATTLTRPSIHGDVIHSRPVPVNYGSSNIVVFYGSNDGYYRAVNAADGSELWSFIPREFLPSTERLMKNKPILQFPNQPAAITPTPEKKNYFWDGSTGLYQNADNSQVWIFPTMRRGGRMIYGIDVTTPSSPSLKWRVGCPNLSNDTGCTAGMSDIGQTWSIPNVGFVGGYSTTTPVLIVGGGNDACEDEDSISPSCATPKGNKVYVLNANDGSLIRAFDTTRSVIADVSLVDVNFDGSVDYAYAADTGGNIWRISFSDPATNATLPSASWTITKAAYTGGGGRKFQFGPALLSVKKSGKFYVYMALGSGDREHPLESDYPFGNVQNKFYMYIDDPTIATSIDLDAMPDKTVDQGCDSTSVAPTDHGWQAELKESGVANAEQTVTSAVIINGLISFSTNRPVPPAAGSCSSILGEARGYTMNLLNASGALNVNGLCGGTRSAIFPGGGLPPSPVVATVMVGGRPQTIVIGAANKEGAASTPIGAQKAPGVAEGRLRRTYWYTNDNK